MKTVFSSNLKILLEEKGLTQAKLAETLGINRSTVQRWIKGATMPTSNDLEELAETLGVNPSQLLRTDEFEIPSEDPALAALKLLANRAGVSLSEEPGKYGHSFDEIMTAVNVDYQVLGCDDEHKLFNSLPKEDIEIWLKSIFNVWGDEFAFNRIKALAEKLGYKARQLGGKAVTINKNGKEVKTRAGGHLWYIPDWWKSMNKDESIVYDDSEAI